MSVCRGIGAGAGGCCSEGDGCRYKQECMRAGECEDVLGVWYERRVCVDVGVERMEEWVCDTVRGGYGDSASERSHFSLASSTVQVAVSTSAKA